MIDGLGDGVLLHSGPPIAWDDVCDPQRRALLAACLLEGWAADRDGAARLLADGEVRLASGNEHGHVGPMTGVCSPSMAVWVVEDEASGVRAFSTLNEGPGRTFWLGVGDDEAVERQRFLRDRARPVLAALLERTGPIDVLGLAAQGLQMGDELHMRSQAAGHLLIRDLAAAFAAEGGEDVAAFIAGNHHFFLNLTMAAAKCASLAAAGDPEAAGSTVVHLMSRNGTEMGVQVAGLPGRWFKAPAAPVQDALLREGHREEDAAPRHRRLGGDRVHRPRRDGDRRGARGRDVLRRHGGGRGRAHPADGRDLRGALEALRDPRPRLRARPGRHRRPPRRRAGHDAADQHRRAARVVGRRADRRGRRAPAARAVPRGARGTGRRARRVGAGIAGERRGPV